MKKTLIYFKKIKVVMYLRTVVLFFSIFTTVNSVYANETTGTVANNGIDIVKDNVGFNDYIKTIQEYVDKNADEEIVGSFDVNKMANELIVNGNINGGQILAKLANIFLKEVILSIKSASIVLIIVILMSFLNNIQLDKNSNVTKVAFLSCYMLIATILIKTFVETLNTFSNTVGVVTLVMQVISPFLMLILLATGAITTTGVIQPIILFLASFIGFAVKNLIVPFLSISVTFNIIDSISDELNLNRLSNMFSKSAIWILGILLTVFLGILSLETQVTSSVDSLAIKTTQAAVSNFVPVVGKFFSDSFETVVGAAKVLGKVGGVIGIVTVCIITIIPILKIASIYFIYVGLGTLSEIIGCDQKLINTFDGFSKVYKTMLGIMVGILILFIISTGIILNLSTSIIK